MKNRRNALLIIVVLLSIVLSPAIGPGGWAFAVKEPNSPRSFAQNEPEPYRTGGSVSTGQRLRKIVSDLVAGLQTSLPGSTSRRVAVMPLTSVRGEQSDLGLYVTEKITSELSATQGRFDVVERRKIKDALTEMKLGETGLLNEASIQSAGKALGADVVVVGTITDLGTEVDIDLRVMEVSTLHVLGRASELLPKDKVVESLLGGQAAPGTSGGSAAKSAGTGGTAMKQVFFDDFKASQLSRYRISSVYKRAARATQNTEAGLLEIVTGDNSAVEISFDLGQALSSGEVEVEFLASKRFPTSAMVEVSALTSSGNGYNFMQPSSHYKSHLANVISGQELVLAERAGDTFSLNQVHKIALQFGPSSVQGEFDGKVVHAVPNDRTLSITAVKLRFEQMDGYVKSIRVEGQ